LQLDAGPETVIANRFNSANNVNRCQSVAERKCADAKDRNPRTGFECDPSDIDPMLKTPGTDFLKFLPNKNILGCPKISNKRMTPRIDDEILINPKNPV
jgi:hypothetical protein